MPVLGFPTQVAWERWLADNGAVSPGIWLKFAKKGSSHPSVGKSEAIEAAISQGWIDGQLDKLDDGFWLVRFTPRRATSRWSQKNRATALKLLAEGRMTPAGRAEVEKARSDGRWDKAYAPQSQAEVPDDLRVALEAEPAAAAFFETLKGANRYAVIYRVNDAKTPKTRAHRIAKFVGMLARGEVLHPPVKE